MSLSENGYHRPAYDELLENMEKTAQEVFGEDIDTREATVLGKIIRIMCREMAKQYDDAEAIYYARYPNTATGVSLDRACTFAGISRNPATFAEYTIIVHGTAGTEVDEIIVCGDNGEITFHNLNSFIIGADGTAEVLVQCETAGTAGNGLTLDQIVNPIADIESISGSDQTSLAEDVESDFDLRKRFALAIEGIGSSNIVSIRTAVLRVPTVQGVSVIENATNETDTYGRPAHSFECYVYGGTGYEHEIAEAIFDAKPIGILTCTTAGGEHAITETVTDECGTDHVIKFSRTEEVPVYIAIEYKTNNNFEIDGETQIKTALCDYINGLGTGEDVILSSLYGRIYAVAGVRDVTALTIGTSADALGGSNIEIDISQISYSDAAKITLTQI